MNKSQLVELARLAENAFAAPWTVRPYYDFLDNQTEIDVCDPAQRHIEEPYRRSNLLNWHDDDISTFDKNDAEFIAAARTAVPEMVAILQTLIRTAETWKKRVDMAPQIAESRFRVPSDGEIAYNCAVEACTEQILAIIYDGARFQEGSLTAILEERSAIPTGDGGVKST